MVITSIFTTLTIKQKEEIKIAGFEESILGKSSFLNIIKDLDEMREKTIKELEEYRQQLIDHKDFLLSLFDGKKFKSKLLFRGSRDGFDAAKFHQLCDNKGPTITLIKSVKGLIFGGFSSINWARNVNNFKSVPGSFLFSLSKKTKHEIYQNQ